MITQRERVLNPSSYPRLCGTVFLTCSGDKDDLRHLWKRGFPGLSLEALTKWSCIGTRSIFGPPPWSLSSGKHGETAIMPSDRTVLFGLLLIVTHPLSYKRVVIPTLVLPPGSTVLCTVARHSSVGWKVSDMTSTLLTQVLNVVTQLRLFSYTSAFCHESDKSQKGAVTSAWVLE
jgi:hypothetical protein